MINSKITIQGVEIEFSYLYSTKDRNNLESYFKFKDKYGYKYTKEEFAQLKKNIIDSFGSYAIVIIPETSGLYLANIAKSVGDKVIVIEKNNKETIKALVSEQDMMKNEKFSLINSIDEMKGSFKINQIKGNQRKRFHNILFKKIDLEELYDKNILLMDDSIFSGNTIIALKENLKINFDIKVIFSKF